MAEEIIDIYDGTGKPLNIAKPKSEVHKNGYWHKSFHCWVIYKDFVGKDFIVLQKRSSNKKTWATKLDITAAGHIISGEGLEGGLREIKEEIGLDITHEKLIPLGTRVCVEEFDPNAINHEFQDVFFLVDNRPLSTYKMQEDEVSGLVAIEVDKALDLFSEKISEIDVDGLVLENGRVKDKTFKIKTTDFIPMLDNYNYKIMVLAKRALNGEKHLLI
jgi:isopentenyldiphosphate isomerase